MALATMAEVLTEIKSNAIPGSMLYNQIDSIRKGMERLFRRYCKWPIEANAGQASGQFHEYYDGTGYVDVQLRSPFVSKVHNVYLDMQGSYGKASQAFSSSTELTQGQDYSLVLEGTGISKSGLLRRMSNNAYWWPSDWVYYRNSGGLAFNKGPFWPRGYGNIKVVYDFGFQPLTPIASASWSSGIATLTFSNAIVARQQDDLRLSSSGEGWNGDYTVATVADDGLSVTFRTPEDPGSFTAGGQADFIPIDIKIALGVAVSLMRNKLLYGGPVTNESLGDYSYGVSIMKEPMFGDVKQILSAYRDWSVGIGL